MRWERMYSLKEVQISVESQFMADYMGLLFQGNEKYIKVS